MSKLGKDETKLLQLEGKTISRVFLDVFRGGVEGHLPHKHNKSIPAQAQRKQADFDDWFKLVDKYHHSDPRAKE